MLKLTHDTRMHFCGKEIFFVHELNHGFNTWNEEKKTEYSFHVSREIVEKTMSTTKHSVLQVNDINCWLQISETVYTTHFVTEKLSKKKQKLFLFVFNVGSEAFGQKKIFLRYEFTEYNMQMFDSEYFE